MQPSPAAQLAERLGVDPADLEDLADRQRARLVLLPARTRSKAVEVSDDF